MTTSPIGETRFPQMLLNLGFLFALIVAAACLVVNSWHMFAFLHATNSAVEELLRTARERPDTPATVTQLGIVARTTMARFALLSCGVSVGMGFGFLGFALFLLGIKGEMDVAAQSESAQIKVARMAPGAFVILCACVLIAVCITFRTEFNFLGGETNEAPTKAAGEATTRGAGDLPVGKPGPGKP